MENCFVFVSNKLIYMHYRFYAIYLSIAGILKSVGCTVKLVLKFMDHINCKIPAF